MLITQFHKQTFFFNDFTFLIIKQFFLFLITITKSHFISLNNCDLEFCIDHWDLFTTLQQIIIT